MTLQIIHAGVQSTVQASPRVGMRGFGVPSAGPADPLAMAFANRLAGNACRAASVEITLGGFEALFEEPTCAALSGGVGEAFINDVLVPFDRTLLLEGGDVLRVAPLQRGMRTYLSVGGGFVLPEVFGSSSTYLPSAFGGLDGRALRPGDALPYTRSRRADICQTPAELRARLNGTAVLRITRSAEWGALTERGRRRLLSTQWRAGRQIDRMGIRLTGETLGVEGGAAQIPSGAVFPGTVQCPEGGLPIILGPDAQTTGGYPRIASVISCDLHRLGQIRPRDRVQFVFRTMDEAEADNRGWSRLLGTWLGALPPRQA